MASLTPSIRTQICHLNCEVIKLPNLSIVPYDCVDKNWSHCVNRMHTFRGNEFCRRSSSSVVNTFCKVCNFKVFAATKSPVDQILPYLDIGNKAQELENISKYTFRTEIGGQVKVLVGRKDVKYMVYIEVSSLPQLSSEHSLLLKWSTFTSDSSLSQGTTIQTPFLEKGLGRHAAELEFGANEAPFYLSFVLYSSLDAVSNESGIRTHLERSFCVPVGMSLGCPAPLGFSYSDDGSVNFALFSRNAENVVLCLYDEILIEPSLEIDLDPYVNRTGDIWHVALENVDGYKRYGYRCKGDILWDMGGRFHAHHVLLDPYAKVLGDFIPDVGDSLSLSMCLGHLCKEPSFDWNGDVRPYLPLEELVVYRLNVGKFTKDKSSQLPSDVAGTFSGVVEKLDHFKALGINAILLEPVFPFDERKGPYLPYHFFSPSLLYGPARDGISTINSMKDMIKKLHSDGIEVLMEVVFTYSAEGGDNACQTISFRGIDNSSYYIVNAGSDSSAGNVFNCNNPVVQQMILDSLRYWVTEFHIDGFCFLNASSLTRGVNGEYLSRPPLIEAIAYDPIISKTKIIADCFSPVDLVFKEIHFPHWKRWAQINTKFCHDIRNFLRGEAQLSALATRLCGSGDIFADGRGPAFSFNFVSRNFGLPLVDLVSFSGSDISSELSWNCGEEGPTNKKTVLKTRLKQVRNFLFILYTSLGIPVLNMGDECGHSNGGSTSYSDRKSFNWDTLKTSFAIQVIQFVAFLSSLRIRRSDLFQKRNYLKEENIYWQGKDLSPPEWEDPLCKFLAVTLKAEVDGNDLNSENGDLFIAFNAGDVPVSAVLPELPQGMVWLCLVDTALPTPHFFFQNGVEALDEDELSTYQIKSHSCALFEGKKSPT